ncbi:MAG: tetratricopeptide repeat protein, partial [Polyangiaceae bacterium]|nr:tetratricopeptide repeat protein [Polyangiaceae bacterium]
MADDEMVRRLRAEATATVDASRQARLLAGIAELEERAGDEAGAARDYLAAYETDADFREPLEGVARLLERRSNLKGLGRFFFDALVDAAVSPDERVRALLMHAAHVAEVSGDFAAAQAGAREATQVEEAGVAEQASAWLMLEIFAAHAGAAGVRHEAFAERARFASDPTWQALLLTDHARAVAASGDVDQAIALLLRARGLESQATWAVASALEQLIHERPAAAGTAEARARAEQHASVLESVATLVHDAIVDSARGDALGVPEWARRPARGVDAWLRAAEERRVLRQFDAAASALDRALVLVDKIDGTDRGLAEAAVWQACIRLAEQTGDTALAAGLAAQRASTETDGALLSALALRMAEHAAAEGDGEGARGALAQALANDPGSVPARALSLDILADGGDAGVFASQLEAYADQLAADEARARVFLLAAHVWAAQAHDTAGARAALRQAGMFGASPEVTARLGRMLAALESDAAWYEESTKRLLASIPSDAESLSLRLELLRLRWARGDDEGADRVVREMADAAATPSSVWIARVVEALAPGAGGERARAAVDALIAEESDAERVQTLLIVAAMRAQAAGDAEAARAHLTRAAELAPDDPLIAAYLIDLHRGAGDRRAAARWALRAARSVQDPELASAFRLEAGFDLWRRGNRRGAIEAMESALGGASAAARVALACASFGVDPDSPDARRRALDEAAAVGTIDPRVLPLERFANELGAGRVDAAVAELSALDLAPAGALNLAGALGRLLLPTSASAPEAIHDATSRLSACGGEARRMATSERLRMAREAGDPAAVARAARDAFEAGGGLTAAIEWLAAAGAAEDPRQEIAAREAAARGLTGEPREALLASAALLELRVDAARHTPLVGGSSPAARLANLDLAPPGCDPRRRTAALDDLDGLIGDDAALDCVLFAGWARFAAADLAAAAEAFATVTTERPNDLAAWEGARACAERTGDDAGRARAAAELGARCADPRRAAAFWEEAGLLWLGLGDDANADRALDASFGRDPTRSVAFDRLFRRVRDRKDHERLLELVRRRLDVSDEPNELQKLYWEQARVLRESGDHDGALEALEHVTMLDPDHVGALALLGEINIRRSRFDEAAQALSRLALLESAPAKSRVTAGVTAVDLYENKLRQPERALDVLRALHAAKISTLPVRERLAKLAEQTGAWEVTAATLEELMSERADRSGRTQAARLAMAIHRDRLSNPSGAAAAVAKLLSEEPSDPEAVELLLRIEHPPEALRPLLEGARTALVTALREAPTEAERIRLLVAVGGALGDDALRHAGLGTLGALGARDPDGDQLFAELSARTARTPQMAIPKAMLRSIVAPGDDGPIADLFILLGPTLSDALGPNLQSCGVGRRERVDPRIGLALRNEIAAWAGALGVHEFDLYVGGKDPTGIQGIPGEPPALVVGSGVSAPLSPVMRARVTRELFGIVRGTNVLRSRDDVSIATVVAAACYFAEVRYEHPPYAMLVEIGRLMARAMSRKARRALPEICSAIAAQ